MHASNSARVKESFGEIAERVGLSSQLGIAADTVPLVRRWLCNEANGRWFMIVDNVDDDITIELQHDVKSMSLASSLPQNEHGAVLSPRGIPMLHGDSSAVNRISLRSAQ